MMNGIYFVNDSIILTYLENPEMQIQKCRVVKWLYQVTNQFFFSGRADKRVGCCFDFLPGAAFQKCHEGRFNFLPCLIEESMPLMEYYVHPLGYSSRLLVWLVLCLHSIL